MSLFGKKKVKTDASGDRFMFPLDALAEAERRALLVEERGVAAPALGEPAVEAGVAVDTGEDAGEKAEQEQQFQRIKNDVHRQVIGRIDLSLIGTMREDDLRIEVRRVAERILADRADMLNRDDSERLVSEVIDETFGLGPLEPLMSDPSISDIMINGAKTVYVERHGKLQKTAVTFVDDNHLIKIIQRIVSAIGRRVDETTPMVDARLKDGSRVNAIIPPLALDGPLVSIRRFGQKPLRDADLIKFQAITPEMLQFLRACIRARLNILISGGTGSGKTTLLNVLSSYIPEGERVATIEDAAELQLQQDHVIRMETRPANVEGEGAIDTRDLVRNALRMRPDRIIIGECRGPEALDMLQAMNTGHDGSLTTVHANSPRDALMRLEMMVGMAGIDVPIWTIRKQIASAVHLIVQSIRLSGGARKIVRISEITGMEGETITMHDVFAYQQTGVDGARNAQGYFEASGVRPNCLQKLDSAGETIPVELFEQRILTGHVAS